MLFVGDDKIYNLFVMGYVIEFKIVEEEFGMDLDFMKNRVFKIVNEGKKSFVMGMFVGIKFMLSYS